LSGLDALAEVSRQHGHIEYNAHHSTLTDEFFNTDHNGDAIAREQPGPTPIMAPMSSASSLRMAEDALNALDPQLPLRTIQEQNRSLVDYSHGLPPAVDNYRSRHALQTFVLEATPEVVEQRPLSPQTPAKQTTITPPVLVQYVHNQPPQELNSVPLSQENDPPESSQTLSAHEQLLQAAQADIEEPRENLQVHQWDGTSPIEPTNVQGKKVRGAFAPDRRSAVKEVRKKGACLRCRMLKKSCDSGDPCKECSRLDNARVWKGACLRTRLAQIFELFSSGLFMVVGHHEVEATKGLGPLEFMPGRLEVSYFPHSGIAMTFPYAKVPSGREDNSSILLINQDYEGFGDRLSFGGRITYYPSRLLARHLETGGNVFKTSQFMKATIRLAMTMRNRLLVAQALELWVCTAMIACKPTEVRAWTHASLPSSSAAAENIDINGNGSRVSVAVDVVFYLQLRRVAERRADDLFKCIMIELEKSLIQRKQSDNFETFIGTILLLRCVEKMCYLYKSFDSLLKAPSSAIGNINPSDLPNPNRTPQWPLEKTPNYFWPQGERFSDLLASMLRLRKVPPEIEIKDGVLKAAQDQPGMVQDYFDSIDLRATTLGEAAFRPMDNDVTAWEFRFLAKVFEKTPGSFLGDIANTA